ncbi:unnamed protein product [Miscanthus lutarioriparius]|uniref:Uncharacterized protein n=1 Tax=Miscanthus lutarioriparius TaxID=422564 RepID=A0A811SSL5_9POAL|nr:unnamed protein product [Miscanthus lutarioriparius]
MSASSNCSKHRATEERDEGKAPRTEADWDGLRRELQAACHRQVQHADRVDGLGEDGIDIAVDDWAEAPEPLPPSDRRCSSSAREERSQPVAATGLRRRRRTRAPVRNVPQGASPDEAVTQFTGAGGAGTGTGGDGGGGRMGADDEDPPPGTAKNGPGTMLHRSQHEHGSGVGAGGVRTGGVGTTAELSASSSEATAMVVMASTARRMRSCDIVFGCSERMLKLSWVCFHKSRAFYRRGSTQKGCGLN